MATKGTGKMQDGMWHVRRRRRGGVDRRGVMSDESDMAKSKRCQRKQRGNEAMAQRDATTQRHYTLQRRGPAATELHRRVWAGSACACGL